jgi:hypothetical protein
MNILLWPIKSMANAIIFCVAFWFVVWWSVAHATCPTPDSRVDAAMYCYDREDPRLSPANRTKQFRNCIGPALVRARVKG